MSSERGSKTNRWRATAVDQLRILAALLEDHAKVEPRIPMVRARARAHGAAGRFWPKKRVLRVASDPYASMDYACNTWRSTATVALASGSLSLGKKAPLSSTPCRGTKLWVWQPLAATSYF